jgi:DNA invertase Pin-like site-specific DNA recombinase
MNTHTDTNTTAIAYISDVILGSSGEVIHRSSQRERIEAWASENGVEILHWYEDELYADSLFDRKGIQALLADDSGADLCVVERVWSLSRNWAELKTLLARLESKGTRLSASSTLWDCVSQMARQHYTSGGLKRREACALAAPTTERAQKSVRRPATSHFAKLRRHHA